MNAKQIEQLKTMLEEYDTDIKPIKKAGDGSVSDYVAYDEAYSMWLEELHTALIDMLG